VSIRTLNSKIEQNVPSPLWLAIKGCSARCQNSKSTQDEQCYGNGRSCWRKKSRKSKVRPDYIPKIPSWDLVDASDWNRIWYGFKIKKKNKLPMEIARGNPKRKICNLRRMARKKERKRIIQKRNQELNKKRETLLLRTANRMTKRWIEHAMPF